MAWFVACSFGNYCFVWGLDGCGGVVGFRVCFGWVVSCLVCVVGFRVFVVGCLGRLLIVVLMVLF